MTTLFFGERWDAPVVDDATRVPTPAGQQCYDCAEPIGNGDRGFLRGVTRMGDDGQPVGSVEPIHAECDLRGVMGHQVGICGCTGHEYGRQTARLVWERVYSDREVAQ